jgi:hypothetical protein
MAGKVEIDIAGLEGNEAAQPRVFAHDAVAVPAADVTVLNSIPLNTELDGLITTNPTDTDPGQFDFTTTNSGSGTPVVLRAIFTGGAGTSTCTSIVCVTPYNSGYVAADTITITKAQIKDALGMALDPESDLVLTLNTTTVPLKQSGFPLVPTPTADITKIVTRGACIYAGVVADVTVKLESGTVVTFKGTAAGSFLPILAIEVVSISLPTGTLANGDILGLF